MSASQSVDSNIPEASGAVDPRTLLEMLFRSAQPHLSSAELAHVARGLDMAEELARNSATLASGLGNLVLADDDGQGGAVAGNFRGADDVSALLFHLAASFQHIEGVVSVASQAACELAQRARTSVPAVAPVALAPSAGVCTPVTSRKGRP